MHTFKNKMKKTFIANVKINRIKRGWRQADLAAVSGFAAGSIQQLESGRRFPRPGTVQVIAQSFGVDPMTLFQEPNT